MSIDEKKYVDLFVTRYNLSEGLLKNNLTIFLKKYGENDKNRLRFFQIQFRKSIDAFKKELPKNEHYEWTITTLYNYFIEALNEDGIDTHHYSSELKLFYYIESPKINAIRTNERKERREYNLNTSYGRRKAREQANRNYENGSPQYKAEIDNIKAVVWTVILFISAVVLLFKYVLFAN